ncbi:MAG: hypothetical protein MSA15_21375 [Clostridium sp.]|nr:hypothetical protein [Clostridium sp.]
MIKNKRLKGSSNNKIKTADIVSARQNTNNRGFLDRLSIGTQGELVVKEFLLKSNYNYIDCTRNSKMLSQAEILAYEKAEIDLLVESQLDYTTKSVEVKTFSKKIEDQSHLCIKVSTQYIDEQQQIIKQDDAYLYRSRAEYLFIVSLPTRNIFSIRTQDLRDYIEANEGNASNVYYKTYKDDKDANHKYDRYNKCAYVNIQDLIDKRLLKNMTKLEA